MLNPQQLEAAKFFQKTAKNIVVEARAGSGKTSWILALSKMPKVQNSNTLYIAFTNAAKDELIKRQPSIKNQVKTIYQLGFAACRRLIDADKIEVNGKKYFALLDEVLSMPDLTEAAKAKGLPTGYGSPYLNELHNLVNLALVNLCFSREKIEDFSVTNHSLDQTFESLVIYRVIQKGIKLSTEGQIHFSDMVAFPFCGIFSDEEIEGAFDSYDIVFLDEAQDTSLAQLTVTQLVVGSGQLVSIGDTYQTIFGFAGSTGSSLDTIKHSFDAKEFTFPLCYRCGDNILNRVRHLVTDIQGTGKDSYVGQVSTYEEAKGVVNPQEDWIVLCRLNAPLIELAVDFLREFVPFRFNRSNIEDSIKIKLSYYKNQDDDFDNLFRLLDIDQKISTQYRNHKSLDIIECIRVILKLNPEISNWSELRSKVRELFRDSNAKVVLGSIHSFKGSEADNVLFYRADLVPFKMAVTPIEIQQEYNLYYVGATRAKKCLIEYYKED